MENEAAHSHSCRLPDVPLTWGISVRVSKLGGALEALVETTPITDALKLCHRYGRGSNAHITKLPREVIDEIVLHVNYPAARAATKKWEQGLRCFEKRCNMDDHVTPADREEIMARYRSEHNGLISDAEGNTTAGNGDAVCDYSSDSELMDMIDEDLQCLIDDNHHDNARNWKDRVLQLSPLNRHLLDDDSSVDLLQNLSKLLAERFGLAAVLTRKTSCPELDATLGYDARTYICYLSLPKLQSITPLGSGAFHRMTSILDPSAMLLTDQAKTQLLRAMQTLRLQPYVHPLQVDLDRTHDSYKENYGVKCLHRIPVRKLEKLLLETARQYKSSTWPKLINLAPEPHEEPIHRCPCGGCYESDDDMYPEDYEVDWSSSTRRI